MKDRNRSYHWGFKITAIGLGVLGALLFLELVLRAAGGVWFWVQDRRNLARLSQRSQMAVLCLGESTTACGGQEAYPAQLQEILKSTKNKIRFTVINKGIPATNTDAVAQNLPKYLKRYKPQIVVAMLGVNDTLEISRAQPPIPFMKSVWRDLRLVKLFGLIDLHLSARKKEVAWDYEKQKRIKELKQYMKRNPSKEIYHELIKTYIELEDRQKAIETVAEALAHWPQNPGFHMKAARLYYDTYDYRWAEQHALRAASLLQDGPMAVSGYLLLAQCFIKTGKLEQAASIHREVLAKIPDNANRSASYNELVDIYLKQGKYKEAGEIFLLQVEADPQSAGSYDEIAHEFQINGLTQELELLLTQALGKTSPGDMIHTNIAVELAYCLMKNGKHAQAEQLLRKIQETQLDSRQKPDIDLNDEIVKVLRAQGKFECAALRLSEMEDQDRYLPATVSNLRRIQDTVLADENRIMVWVQYPMRSLAPLQQAVGGWRPRVIFVDNNKIFRQAVQERGYTTFFQDHFAGNFGHGTPEGNRLLAQNVARAILKHLNLQ